MAKTAISGGDLTTLRGNQSIPDLSLFVTPLQEVVTGTITAVPAKYPTVSLTVTWDAATTGTSVGQLVRISNGSTIRTYSVVRKAISGSTLYLSETPLGAFGYATMIESPILVGDTVTIYNHRPLWGMYSRIDAKTKTFYKMWDVAYTNQNEGDTIVANAGAWQAAKLGTGETTARFTLPRGGVNSSFNIAGGSISGYEWTLPDGVTLVAGYALDEEIIEVDAVAGSHLISMYAEVGGKNHTAYLWLFVSDGTNSLDCQYAISLPQSDSQSRVGREMAFQVTGANLKDVLFPGAGFMLREWPHYDSGSLSEGVGIDTFIGYICDIEFSHDGDIGTATFKVESPMIYASRIAQAPQSLEEVTETAKWTECEQVLSNPCGFLYYLIRWHSPALLEMHDFDAEDYITPRRKYLQCNTRNLGAALQVVAEYIAGNVGSASDGTTVLRANPLYMTQTNRDAVATILTFQEQDIAAPLEYARRQYNAYAEVRGGAFAWGGSGKPKAFYVGRRWSQGSGSVEMPNFTVTASQGVTEAKSKIGHFFAEQNAEIQEIGLGLTLNIDALDPAYMTWAAFTIGSEYDPYGLGFSSNRLLPASIEREWSLENGNIRKLIKVRSQGETFGQAGEELPIGASGSQNGFYNGTPAIWQPYTSGGMFGGSQSASLLLINNDEGKFAVCLNYYTANPEWFDLQAGVDNEAVNDFCFDYGSAFFASGRDASQALGVYAVTIDGVTAHIWYFADILRSSVAENIKSLTLSDSTIETEARILCSESYPLLVLAGFKDGTGTRYSRSTDGGATFGSLTRVGSAITDTADNDNAPLGMWVDGQRQLISAPDATPVYGTYLATSAGGAFSKVTGSQDSAYVQPMMHIAPDLTTAYVTSNDVASMSNDFDSANFFPYDNTVAYATPSYHNFEDTADWVFDGVVGSGLSGDCVQFTGTNPQGEGVGVDRAELRFVLPSSMVVYNVTFDVWYSTPLGQHLAMGVGIGSGSGSSYLNDTMTWNHIDFRSRFPAFFSTASIADIGISFSPRTDCAGTMTVRFDNVVIYAGAGAKLWKVTNITTSPVWTNISPASGNAPEYPHNFAVDRVNTSILNTVTELGTDWYRSTNSGSSWSTFANNTPYRALYTQDQSIAAAGLLSVALSLNGGDEFADLEGNLDSLWSSDISRIKRILAL